MCFVLFYFSETQFPATFKSAGIVAIISAIIGVALTAFAVSIQLKQQSDTDAQRKKNVKIFEQKIRVYSGFTKKLWEMFDDAKVTDEELKELRKICFKTLVFYLDSEQIKEIAQEIEKIEIGGISDATKIAAGQITHILRQNLNETKKSEQRGDLITLFNSFDNKVVEKEEPEQVASIVQEQQITNDVQYWHFNILDEKLQIAAFKQGNWVLALIEYGEVWRTNLLRQVKPNDVIFLFQRGGAGYVGAFKALDPPSKILEGEKEKSYSDVERAKYDIYEGIPDGATLASNILVEPIAYNFKGVEYYTVRRRTIERMNDPEAVRFLLNRFNGKELDKDRLSGQGKLDIETPVTLNKDYFSKIIRKHNLQ
jgi:hypothetical protein